MHDANEKDLKGLIVQVTGLGEDSKLIASMIGTFKTLKDYADFNSESNLAGQGSDDEDELTGAGASMRDPDSSRTTSSIRLGYTINLNLPATTDIAVFNAIFKSLKEHLL